MFILVPWKPVAIVFGFLAALMLFSYYGSALIQGKNPFAPYGTAANHVTPGQAAARSAPDHKQIHKPTVAAKSD